MSPSGLYRDADHRYWLYGRELVSVTSAISGAGLVPSAHYSDESRDRGTAVHAIAAATLRGEECYIVDDQHVGYAAAFEQWVEDERPTVTHVETMLANPVAGFAGTLDVAGSWTSTRVAGAPFAIGDFKTGGPAPWHGLQLAAYAYLLHGAQWMRCARYGIYLRADGTYSQRIYDDRSDLKVFLCALDLARWRTDHCR